LIRGFIHLLMIVCLSQLLPGNLCICRLPYAIAHSECENCQDSCPFQNEDCEIPESDEHSSNDCHCSLTNSDSKIYCEPETLSFPSETACWESFSFLKPNCLTCPTSLLALQKSHPPFLPRHLLLGILVI